MEIVLSAQTEYRAINCQDLKGKVVDVDAAAEDLNKNKTSIKLSDRLSTKRATSRAYKYL